MLTMLLQGLYIIVDGFFVGQAIGDRGLAAINIAWPITAIILALGTGIGMGGAVNMSLEQGKGNKKDSNIARGNTIILLLIASIILTIIFWLNYEKILSLLGATGEVHVEAARYTKFIIIGCIFQVFATGLTPLLRNSKKTIEAMIIMIVGLVTNIILDAVFIMILNKGMEGAAIATIIAQGVTTLLCIIIFIKDKDNKIEFKEFILVKGEVKKILRTGLSPFGLSLSPSIIIVFNNFQCLKYGGDIAVAAYSVIAYVIGTGQLLLSGVGEGIQPLISFCSGGKLFESMKIIKRKAIIFILALSFIILFAMILFRDIIPLIFGSSPEATEIMSSGLVITSLALPCIALVKLASSYFYAVGESTYSSIIIYGDPILITPILILILPRLFKLEGVWITLPLAQIMMSISILFMNNMHNNKIKQMEILHG
jgi:putative MATE family efflux protein